MCNYELSNSFSELSYEDLMTIDGGGISDIDWGEVGKAAVSGAVTGGVGGAAVGGPAAAGPGALVGAITGSLGSVIIQLLS